jgi:hypothetical protein
MNKYQIGQTVYWVKFSYNMPAVISFEIGSIKQDKIGYKYSDGKPGSSYVQEHDLFLSKAQAVEDSCDRLRKLKHE